MVRVKRFRNNLSELLKVLKESIKTRTASRVLFSQKINYMSEYSVILRSKYNIKIQKSIHPYLMLCDYKLKVPRFRALQWYNNMMR